MANVRKVINPGQFAGLRMASRLRLISEITTAELSKQDRLDFWLAIAREVTSAIDDCTADDATAQTRH